MLADVTDASNSYRSTGSPGFAAAAEAVAASLRASGWTVSDDPFTAPTFTDDGGSSLEVGEQTFGDDDIRPLIFAPAGDVTGPVVAIDWQPGATARDGKGCRTADYGDLPDGAVVLVRPGPCYRRDQVLAAQAAGAAAFVAGYGGAASGAAPRATLIDPGGLTIPAIGATGHAADALGGGRQGWRRRPGGDHGTDGRGLHQVDHRRAARKRPIVGRDARRPSRFGPRWPRPERRWLRRRGPAGDRARVAGHASPRHGPTGLLERRRARAAGLEPLRRRPDRGRAGSHRGLPQRGHDRITERLRRRLPRGRRTSRARLRSGPSWMRPSNERAANPSR